MGYHHCGWGFPIWKQVSPTPLNRQYQYFNRCIPYIFYCAWTSSIQKRPSTKTCGWVHIFGFIQPVIFLYNRFLQLFHPEHHHINGYRSDLHSHILLNCLFLYFVEELSFLVKNHGVCLGRADYDVNGFYILFGWYDGLLGGETYLDIAFCNTIFDLFDVWYIINGRRKTI